MALHIPLVHALPHRRARLYGLPTFIRYQKYFGVGLELLLLSSLVDSEAGLYADYFADVFLVALGPKYVLQKSERVSARVLVDGLLDELYDLKYHFDSALATEKLFVLQRLDLAEFSSHFVASVCLLNGES